MLWLHVESLGGIRTKGCYGYYQHLVYLTHFRWLSKQKFVWDMIITCDCYENSIRPEMYVVPYMFGWFSLSWKWSLQHEGILDTFRWYCQNKSLSLRYVHYSWLLWKQYTLLGPEMYVVPYMFGCYGYSLSWGYTWHIFDDIVKQKFVFEIWSLLVIVMKTVYLTRTRNVCCTIHVWLL